MAGNLNAPLIGSAPRRTGVRIDGSKRKLIATGSKDSLQQRDVGDEGGGEIDDNLAGVLLGICGRNADEGRLMEQAERALQVSEA